MTRSIPRTWAAFALLVLTVGPLAAASGPIVVGPDRHELRELQRRVDRLVGPGQVDVRTDFLGANPGDPDPGLWQNPGHAMELTLVNRRSPSCEVGWYAESSTRPVLDGVDDGCVLDSRKNRGDKVVFQLPTRVKRFGFYVAALAHDGAGADAQLTNRQWESSAGRGKTPRREPIDAARDMLVFDISHWVGPDTWLVACETSARRDDLGRGHEDDDDDDDERDYADVLFVVSGGSVTPALKTTFGRVKALYR